MISNATSAVVLVVGLLVVVGCSIGLQAKAHTSPPKCGLSTGEQALASGVGAGLFAVVANPLMFKATNALGLKTLDASNSPTAWGFILHIIVYFGILWLLMLPSAPKNQAT